MSSLAFVVVRDGLVDEATGAKVKIVQRLATRRRGVFVDHPGARDTGDSGVSASGRTRLGAPNERSRKSGVVTTSPPMTSTIALAVS